MFDVVYFSSVSENTKRFVDKLEAQTVRIPIRTEEAAEFVHDRDSVLSSPPTVVETTTRLSQNR
jgi:protein involved in ribonucleotide reduction